ncbi:MAG: SIMPL domain-containing protein [Candidatus Nomurabacteria bacterium]|nr:SIMPL domain-containing protein [Candidatus Nomurabacteria bacterium]
MNFNFSNVDPKKALMFSGSVFLSLGALFMVFTMIGQIVSFSFINGGNQKTITVTGSGEAVSSPDIATFSFSANSERPTIEEAQAEINKTVSMVLESLDKKGIDKDDIKTASYNAFPRYEYTNTIRCIQAPCPPNNKRVLAGYEVSQSINITVRDLGDVSDVVAILGNADLDSFYGPEFTVDDNRDLFTEARADAIVDAKKKAKTLAGELGVRLGKIVSFSDGSGGYEPPMAYTRGMAMGIAESASFAPELPTGTSEFSANVSITYRIK